jgi:hypothetical protein
MSPPIANGFSSGDLTPIKSLILNRSADEYGRGAGLDERFPMRFRGIERLYRLDRRILRERRQSLRCRHRRGRHVDRFEGEVVRAVRGDGGDRVIGGASTAAL